MNGSTIKRKKGYKIRQIAKRKEMVESHDYSHPKETWQLPNDFFFHFAFPTT